MTLRLYLGYRRISVSLDKPGTWKGHFSWLGYENWKTLTGEQEFGLTIGR